MEAFIKIVFAGTALLLHLINISECFSYGLDNISFYCPFRLYLKDDREEIRRIVSDVLCKDSDSLKRRPVKYPDDITHVAVAFTPTSFKISEADSLFIVYGSVNMSWMNELVHWDPNQYGSVTYLHLEDTRSLWQPKVKLLYDYSEMGETDLQDTTDMIIQSNGTTTAIFDSRINGHCQHDPRAWPFGVWKCRIRLVSLSRDAENVGVELKSFDPLVNVNTSALKENKVWSVVLNQSYFTVAEFTNSSLDLSITLQRHTSYHVYSLLLPGIVLFLLSLVSFLLTDRIHYRIMVNTITAWIQLLFLLIMVFLLKTSGSKGNPLMRFVEDSMFVSLMGILFAIVNAKLMRKTIDPPKYVMKTIDGVSIVPYVGPVLYSFINENGRAPSGVLADEVALVTDFHNPEWKIVRSAIDKCAFVLILFYFLTFRFL